VSSVTTPRGQRAVREDKQVSPEKEAASQAYPVFSESLPDVPIARGRYSLRFARSPEELESIQRLRFEVFNLELGEGLDESYATGRDEDRFDPVCHHLMVLNSTGEVIGTYRMQTNQMAARHGGYYSADEFDLTHLPSRVTDDAVEIGRACVAKPHRNRHVLFLLWRGLAAYMSHNHKRYLFGCCSLTSQDPAEGKRVMDYLAAEGHVHPTIDVPPQPDWRCYDGTVGAEPSADDQEVELPKLFSLYLRYRAKVCGAPALDRYFKTIDYLVLFDLEDLSAESRATFFE
jgi:putative hemolysin